MAAVSKCSLVIARPCAHAASKASSLNAARIRLRRLPINFSTPIMFLHAATDKWKVNPLPPWVPWRLDNLSRNDAVEMSESRDVGAE
jgi:hypothetical protein